MGKQAKQAASSLVQTTKAELYWRPQFPLW